MQSNKEWVSFLIKPDYKMEKTGQKRTALSLQQKLQILMCLKNGESRKQVSKKFSCDVSTIAKIVKNKDQIEGKLISSTNDVARKRFRSGKFEKENKIKNSL